MTNKLAIRILECMVEHEENETNIFGNPKENIGALTLAIKALKLKGEKNV